MGDWNAAGSDEFQSPETETARPQIPSVKFMSVPLNPDTPIHDTRYVTAMRDYNA